MFADDGVNKLLKDLDRRRRAQRRSSRVRLMPDAMHPAVSVSNHHIQQQTAYQTAHRDNGSSIDQDLMVSPIVRLKYSLKTRSPDRSRERKSHYRNQPQYHQLRANTRRCNQRCRDTTRVIAATVAEPSAIRSTAAIDQPSAAEKCWFRASWKQCICPPAVYQHLLERTATTDNQQHHAMILMEETSVSLI